MPLNQMQAALMATFKRWGMPDTIRVDNGQPFGDPQGVTIPPLALWLLSIGIKVIWNRPCQPTDNAQVERMQGTTSRWAEAKQATALKQLQHRLDQAVAIQRARYPVRRLGDRTRLETYPELCTPRRVYLSDGFKPERAHHFLAAVRFVRKVSEDGRIKLYEHGYQVGSDWSKQKVQVHLDADTLEWIVTSEQGQAIRRVAAKGLTPSNIRELTVCKRT